MNAGPARSPLLPLFAILSIVALLPFGASTGCGTTRGDHSYATAPGADAPGDDDPPPAEGRSDGGAPGDAAPDAPVTAATVRVHYPAGAHQLALRGSALPLDWNTGRSLQRGADDTWTITLDPAPPRFEFKPLLDDTTWSIGPNYVADRGSTVDIYPRFTTVAGHVFEWLDALSSNELPARAVWAYLPPSYDENTTARFPVLYMHDGQNLFDPTRAFGGSTWKVDETLDAAAMDGTIRELIVIGIDNTPDRIAEYTGGSAAGARGDAYGRLLIDVLKPRVDASFRTLTSPDDTGIFGSSMGGHISSYLGARRPDVFGHVGAMSPTVFGPLLPTIAGLDPNKPVTTNVYLDTGTVKDNLEGTEALFQAYLGAGWSEGKNLRKVVQQGATHNEVYWAARLPEALAFLFGPRR